MGQVALGFRSLIFKLAVFFVLAALLAWILGGTLWPRAETADFPSVAYDNQAWFWRLEVGGKHRGVARWQLMVSTSDGDPVPVDERCWSQVAGPVVTDSGLYIGYTAEMTADASWMIERLPFGGSPHPMPDRLAVERQLARVVSGLPLQDQSTIERSRSQVLGDDSSLQ